MTPAGGITSTVKSQGTRNASCWGTDHSLFHSVRELVPPTFWVGLLTSINPISKILHRLIPVHSILSDSSLTLLFQLILDYVKLTIKTAHCHHCPPDGLKGEKLVSERINIKEQNPFKKRQVTKTSMGNQLGKFRKHLLCPGLGKIKYREINWGWVDSSVGKVFTLRA